jgi:phage gp45-like
MIRQLKNLIRFARVSLTNDDTATYANTQVSGLGKTTDGVTTIYPYGLFANAPVNTFCVTLQPYGQEEALVVIPFSPQDKQGASLRFKNLKEGEVALGNVLTGSVIKFLADGSIAIDGQQNVKVTVTGDVDISATGNINISSEGTTTITSTGACKIESSGETTVKGTTVTVDSPAIKLGAGAIQGIARLGDQVQVVIPPPSPGAGTWPGTIISASLVNKSL